jgi:hypothetical protein
MSGSYPFGLDQQGFDSAHDQMDSERTIHAVKPNDDSAFVELRKSVEEARKQVELRLIRAKVLLPRKP